jgi:hypothetical protein
MPRHPPNALTSLDRSHCQCSSSVKAIANRPSPIDPKIDCRLPHSDCLTSLATFYNQTIQMPSTCSIRSLSEGTPVHFKAGSSRPASRDQIRGCAVRQHPPDRSASRPLQVQHATILDWHGPQSPSGSIFSSQWIKIRQNRVSHAACKLRSFSKKTKGQSPFGNRQSNIVPIRRPTGARPHAKRAVRSEATQRSRQREDKTPSIRKANGGAERDRTADPLLAKQVLSQLSYSPNLSLTARSALRAEPARARQTLGDGPRALRKPKDFRAAQRERSKMVNDPQVHPDIAQQVQSTTRLVARPVRSEAAKPRQRQDRTWWARVDSNYRPHAYQACALTD